MPSATDISHAAAAAACVVETHRRLVDRIAPGKTLAQLDAFIAEALASLDAPSCFLGYRVRGHPPFPSHACLSVNEVIVHGTHDMSDRPLEEGDIVSIDIGVRHRGWIGDAAWTYAVRTASPLAANLMRAGKESLRRGIAAMQPGRPLTDWARAVQGCVEREFGFHLVRGLGGHGYGKSLHAAPYISNTMPGFPGEWPDARVTFKPGMLLAVEPMLAATTTEIESIGSGWPIYTADRSLSVHYEADVHITPEGPVNLTAGLFDLPDVVG